MISPSPLFFAATLFVVLSFDYVWIGPIPLWFVPVGLACMWGAFSKSHWLAFLRFVDRLRWPVILPWLLYVAICFLLDLTEGFNADQFTSLTLANCAALILLLVFGAWSSITPIRTVVICLAVIGSFQGVVAIAQFAQVDGAWEIAAEIGGKVASSSDFDMEFEDVNRVRGTQFFVHKFAVLQGMLAGALVVVAVLGTAAKTWRKAILTASIVTAVGLALTFSRSAILGFLVTAFVAVLFSRRVALGLMVLTFIAGCTLLASLHMGIDEAKALTRLLDFSSARITNASRFYQYTEALSLFKESPISGDPSVTEIGGMGVHSVLLRNLVQYGILGMSLYLTVLYGIFKAMFFAAGRSETPKFVALAGCSVLFIGTLDAWTHTSGLLSKDFLQPSIFGVFLGAVSGIGARQARPVRCER